MLEFFYHTSFVGDKLGNVFPYTNSMKIFYSILAISALLPVKALAVPAYPGKAILTQPDGTRIEVSLIGDEHGHVTVDSRGMELRLDENGFWLPTNRQGSDRLKEMRSRRSKRVKSSETSITSFPRTGNPRTMIVLVDFPDIPFVTPDVKKEFDEMLNLPGFDRREHIGSAADYFRAQSLGKFSPQFDVYGPIRADKPATYYGENDQNGDDMRAYELAIELCRKLDSQVDFTEYDLDGDGMIDNIYFFYAGYGENFAGNKAAWIWPHAEHISSLGIPEDMRTFDGKLLNSYGCCAELYGSTGQDVAAIGTFCHEFGHILGLPDTYDVNYSVDGSGNHPDRWDIMASGSYLPETRNCGAVPAGYTALERWLLGWADPVEITRPQSVELEAIHEAGKSVKIPTAHPDEFFLLENRQQTRSTYDRFIPSHGLLVWHIDRRPDATFNVTVGNQNMNISPAMAWELDYNAVNSNANHQCLEIEKASGNDGSKSSLDTPFPGRQLKTEFTDYTEPSMKNWDNRPTARPVTNIKELAGKITFDYMGGSDNKVAVNTKSATEVTADGFTANWEHHPDAEEGYKLRVYSVEKTFVEDMPTLDEDFASMPETWRIEGSGEINNSALTLGGNTASTLISPEIDLTPGGVLTLRTAQNGSAAATLTVSVGENVLDEFIPTEDYTVYKVTVPEGTEARDIRFSVARRKSVRIDNITLVQDATVIDLNPINELDAHLEHGVTSHRVTVNDPDLDYAYSVEAKGYVNSAGPVMMVEKDLQTGIGITPVENEDNLDDYYTIDGVKTTENTKGIIISGKGKKFLK